MGRIIVMNSVTLDGVMQGPARPDEDRRGGFTHSGWALRSAQSPEEITRAMSERMAAGGGLKGWLFGRWTYEDLLAVWNARGGPFKDALNNGVQIRRLDDARRAAAMAKLDAPPGRRRRSRSHPQGTIRRGPGDHG